MRARVEGAERDAAALTAAKARLAAAERAQRASEWELEVCRQRLEQVGSWGELLVVWRGRSC